MRTTALGWFVGIHFRRGTDAGAEVKDEEENREQKTGVQELQNPASTYFARNSSSRSLDFGALFRTQLNSAILTPEFYFLYSIFRLLPQIKR
jgi:hypothetical protein